MELVRKRVLNKYALFNISQHHVISPLCQIQKTLNLYLHPSKDVEGLVKYGSDDCYYAQYFDIVVILLCCRGT